MIWDSIPLLFVWNDPKVPLYFQRHIIRMRRLDHSLEDFYRDAGGGACWQSSSFLHKVPEMLYRIPVAMSRHVKHHLLSLHDNRSF